MGELSIHMLGIPSVHADGIPVAFPYSKAEALLYYLLLKKRAARSELIGLLWADSDSATALRNLRHAIYTVKKSLSQNIFLSGQRTLLELRPDLELSCDVIRFLQGGDLSLYRGEFLQGFSIHQAEPFEEWITEQRSFLQLQYLKRLLDAQKEALRKGDLAAAERLGLSYLETDPMDEEATVALMRVYSAQQNFRKANDLYCRLCQLLSEEFGISPLRSTSALYYQILDSWNSSTDKDADFSSVLIGKDAPLRRLRSFYTGALPRENLRCLLIEGAAGVGKTCLVNYVVNHCACPDRLLLRSYCYPSEADTPFAPWNAVMLTILSEVNRASLSLPQSVLQAASALFPCLSACAAPEAKDMVPLIPAGNHPVEASCSAALHSALLLLMMVARERPIMLIFEDLHWMDSKSTELLSLLLHRVPTPQLLVLCTSRTIVPEHVERFFSAAGHDQLLERRMLCNFTPEETSLFIKKGNFPDCSEDRIREIYRATKGNPLLLVQLLNSFRDGGAPSMLPSGLEGLMHYRLSNISPEERQVLNLVSAFTEWVSFDTLSAILTLQPLELTYICHQLCQKMLLQESVQDGRLCYMPSHEQIRLTLARQQTATAQRLLHLRIVQHLEAQLRAAPSPAYGRLIYHCAAGGDRIRLLQYRVLALNAYIGLSYVLIPTLESGDSEQEDHAGLPAYLASLGKELSALRLSSPEHPLLNASELMLLHSKSRYCIYVGEYADGLKAAYRLLELSERLRDFRMCFRAHNQCIYYGIQTYDASVMEAHLRAEQQLLSGPAGKTLQTGEQGVYLRLSGLLRMMRGDYQGARALLARSVFYFEQMNDRSREKYDIHIAGAYNYIAESYRMERDYPNAFRNYRLAIRHNRSQGYYPGAAVFYTNFGVAAFQWGRRSLAFLCFHHAQSLYRLSHEYSGYPIMLSYLALYRAAAGDFSTALEALREAFLISEQIASPWWKGIALYSAWKIRSCRAFSERAASLAAPWPEDAGEHLRQCLDCLRRMPPTLEAEEIEKILQSSGSSESSLMKNTFTADMI